MRTFVPSIARDKLGFASQSSGKEGDAGYSIGQVNVVSKNGSVLYS